MSRSGEESGKCGGGDRKSEGEGCSALEGPGLLQRGIDAEGGFPVLRGRRNVLPGLGALALSFPEEGPVLPQASPLHPGVGVARVQRQRLAEILLGGRKVGLGIAALRQPIAAAAARQRPAPQPGFGEAQVELDRLAEILPCGVEIGERVLPFDDKLVAADVIDRMARSSDSEGGSGSMAR